MAMNEDINMLYQSEDNQQYIPMSQYLTGLFNDWKLKRSSDKENDWIEAKNAYDAIYTMAQKRDIQERRSRYFYPITTTKVNQFTSRAIELVLPNGDKNFYLYSTPNPNLPKNVLENAMQTLYEQAFQQQKEVTDEDADRVIENLAMVRADRMEKTVFDQLLNSGYKELINSIITSAAIYGTGVSRGPFNKIKKDTKVNRDENGNVSVSVKEVETPHYEFMKIWDFFPDLDAKNRREMTGAFFYHTMNKGDLLDLADDQGFIKKNVRSFIAGNPDGNFKYEPYEMQLITYGNESSTATKVRRYRLKEYWGAIPNKYLKDIDGLLDDTAEDYEDTEMCVWMLDNIVIKCVKNPFPKGTRPYQFFNYQETDSQLLGTGIPKLICNEQAALNSAARAWQDNMALSAIPIYEINQELCEPGQEIKAIFPGKTFIRHSNGSDANAPVVRTSPVDNNTQQFQILIQDLLRRVDLITNLNQIMAGDMSNQATLGRTSSGITQLMGAANVVLRGFARSFDEYNEMLVASCIEWNILFNDDNDIKGDYDIYPRVSTALIEKSIISNSLLTLTQTLSPQELQYIDPEKLLDAKLHALNLDPDLVKYSASEYAQKQQNDAQTQAQQQQIAQQQQDIENRNKEADTALKTAKAEQAQSDAKNAVNNTDINRLKTLSGIEASRSKQELQNAQFGNQVMNDEQANPNFSQEDLANIQYALNSQNPNINP